MLASEDGGEERRRSPRVVVEREVTVCFGDLDLTCVAKDVAPGGVFVSTQVLVEVGERGTLEIDGRSIAVEVVWLRGNTHADGPGMGLAFRADVDQRDAIVARLRGR